MALYKYIRQLWKQPGNTISQLQRDRMVQWRTEPATLRLDRPTRIDRARSLGYRAKQGIFVVRQRVVRGGRSRPHDLGGRRPKHNRLRKVLGMNYQWVAERRCQTFYKNCEVLNSYWVGQDGRHYWYEVIMIDRSHPAIMADQQLGWVKEPQHRGRVFRGLTSAGRRSRGLHNKGIGAEKARPSSRAKGRKIK